MPSINDWPGVTDTTVTSAGLSEMIRGLTPEQVADLQQRAADLREGRGPEKIDRSYLRFPEAQGNGQPGQRQLATYEPSQRGKFGDMFGTLSPKRQLIAQWFRTIVESPRGMAMHYANDPIVKRVLGEAGQSEGGYVVPPGFIQELIMDGVPLNMLQPWVRTIPVSLPVGTLPLEATSPQIFWGAENTDISEGDPEFDDCAWSVNRMNSLTKMSRELTDDSPIVDYVMSLFQRCIIEERDRVIAVGNGSGQPMGLYSASGIYDTGITSLTYDNMVKLKYSIDMRYHGLRSFRWTMNQTVLENILEITDSMGRPIFNNAIAGAPPTILGVPFSISNAFPNTYIGIGALEFYILFDRQQVTVESTTEGGDAFQAHQRWIKIILRLDGKPALPPVKPLARSTVLAGVS